MPNTFVVDCLSLQSAKTIWVKDRDFKLEAQITKHAQILWFHWPMNPEGGGAKKGQTQTITQPKSTCAARRVLTRSNGYVADAAVIPANPPPTKCTPRLTLALSRWLSKPRTDCKNCKGRHEIIMSNLQWKIYYPTLTENMSYSTSRYTDILVVLITIKVDWRIRKTVCNGNQIAFPKCSKPFFISNTRSLAQYTRLAQGSKIWVHTLHLIKQSNTRSQENYKFNEKENALQIIHNNKTK